VLSVLPSADEVPAGQEAQTVASVVVEDVAPARAYLPIGQVTGPEQSAEERPVIEPYFPAGQTRQDTPVVVYDPTGHFTQSLADVLPATEIEPKGQVAQTAARVSVAEVALATAYFPAGQVIGPVQVATWRPVDEP
jgi:hypothetical protein